MAILHTMLYFKNIDFHDGKRRDFECDTLKTFTLKTKQNKKLKLCMWLSDSLCYTRDGKT